MLCPGGPVTVTNPSANCPDLEKGTTLKYFPNITQLFRGDIILTCPLTLTGSDDKIVVSMQTMLGLPPSHARFTHATVYDPDYWIWDVDLDHPVGRRLLSKYVDSKTCLQVIRPYTLTGSQRDDLLTHVRSKTANNWTLAITDDVKNTIQSSTLAGVRNYVSKHPNANLMVNNTARSFTCASLFLDSWNELFGSSRQIAQGANIPYGPGHLSELADTHGHSFKAVDIEWVDIAHCFP